MFLCLVTGTACAQVQSTTALLGSWSGKLNVGAVSLTLVLNLEQKDGYVAVTLDSPDQGAKDIPAYKEYLSDDSISIHIDAPTSVYFNTVFMESHSENLGQITSILY